MEDLNRSQSLIMLRMYWIQCRMPVISRTRNILNLNERYKEQSLRDR